MEKFKNREIDYTKPVRIYRNLHRKGKVYSIKQKGVVVAHTEEFTLKNVKFIVNKKGKERAIREKVRNVHAFIEGVLVNIKDVSLNNFHTLNYVPFQKEGFYVNSLSYQEIKEASIVFKVKDSDVIKVKF